MIRIEQVSKKFRGRPALQRVSFEVRRGEIFGLLGHNGAGKSTTFGVLLGHVFPDAGEAFIDDVSVQKDRSRALRNVGAIFETPSFFDYMSGWRNLEIFTCYSAIVPKAEMEEVVAFVVSRNPVSAEDLDSLCKNNIARFKRPREYRFVDALPKNNYGKVLKTALREMAARPTEGT